jgi:peptide maturation system protein (TIGR04066 family)
MKKLLINPFTKSECPIIRHRHMLNDYEIVAAIPEKGYGFEGKDVCVLDGGEPTGVILSNPYDEKMPSYDVKLSEITNDKFISGIPETRETLPTDKLMKIPIPVAVVMGNGSDCQKFDIQLGLRETFLKEGYKVSQFGTKSYSKLFGFDPLPDLSDLPFWKKVYAYNNLFYEKCRRDDSDVIIIGVPGGVMPITSYACERFGEEALAISFAANPDIAVFSCYFTIPTQEYFDTYNYFMRFRLGINTVVYHLSNTKIITDFNLNKLSYLTLESKFVLDEVKHKSAVHSSQLFNALIADSAKSAYEEIMEKLQENVCIL